MTLNQDTNSVTYQAQESIFGLGFKDTQIGSIPSEWDVKSLSEVTSIIIDNRGKTPPLCRNGAIELIETASISFVVVAPNYEKISKFVSEDTYKNWFRGHPRAEDILISTVGEYSGATAMMLLNRGTIAQNLISLRLKGVNSRFVFYWTRSNMYRKQLDQVMMNQAQPSLRVPWLLGFHLPIPSLEEQAAIANALSDVDALIQELEKLIAKKQAIKTATMQQLLTGRTRLPQFAHHPDGRKKGYKPSELGEIPEDWEVVFLGDLATIKTGSRNNQDKEANGAYPFFVRSETIERLNTFSYDCEAILVPGEGGIGSIFHYIHGKFDAHQRVYVIRNFQNCSGKFVYLQMRQNFGAHAMENSVKATVDSLRLPTFQNFTLLLPSVEEQDEVARILWNMDEEVKALGHRLAKTRQIKQGMMQELLTGKTRLVKPAGSA